MLKTDMNALYKESEEQEKQVGLFKGCRIKIWAGRANGGIVVETFPGESPQDSKTDAREYDFNDKKIGESYAINAPVLFPNNAETLRKHKIFGKTVTSDWEISIIKNVKDYEASLVSIIRNLVDNISSFIDKEEKVNLVSIFLDVQNKRDRNTVRRYEGTVNDFEAQARGYPSNSKHSFKIPTVDSSMKQCDGTNNKVAQALTLMLNAEVMKRLNPPQVAAIKNIMGNKISIM